MSIDNLPVMSGIFMSRKNPGRFMTWNEFHKKETRLAPVDLAALLKKAKLPENFFVLAERVELALSRIIFMPEALEDNLQLVAHRAAAQFLNLPVPDGHRLIEIYREALVAVIAQRRASRVSYLATIPLTDDRGDKRRFHLAVAGEDRRHYVFRDSRSVLPEGMMVHSSFGQAQPTWTDTITGKPYQNPELIPEIFVKGDGGLQLVPVDLEEVAAGPKEKIFQLFLPHGYRITALAVSLTITSRKNENTFFGRVERLS